MLRIYVNQNCMNKIHVCDKHEIFYNGCFDVQGEDRIFKNIYTLVNTLQRLHHMLVTYYIYYIN